MSRSAHHTIRCILAACLVLATGPAFCGFQALRITDTAKSVVLDGKLDDAVWQTATVYDTFYQTQPVDKVAAKVRTEVKLVYDSRYLYVGIMAFDPNPAQIAAPFARRDKSSEDQDLVGLYIDTSGGKKNAQFIYVNARGAVSDGNFTDAGGEDNAPDFAFDAATARVEGGWSTEIRIPFTSLPYAASQTTAWRLLVYRNMTREQRYRMYSGPVTLEASCLLCFAEPIENLHDLPTGLNWTATPQLVLGRGYEDVAGEPRRNFRNRDLGLDVKIRPDSATTIDATINPDFSQIELNDAQLTGNTRFGLFVTEKRPFFLEGSDILQTPFRAIHTRTITDPSVGLRYTRRDSDRDLTILTTHDAGGGLVQVPGAYATDFVLQNFSSVATVARANFHLGDVSVGGLVTDRTLDGGRGYNRVAGPDFTWQRGSSERLRGQVLFSSTTAQPGADGELLKGPQTTGRASKFEWSKDDERWGVLLATEEITDGFRADNGYIPQVGYKELGGVFTAKLGQRGILNELKTYLYLVRRVDRDGNVIADDFYPGVWMSGPYNTQIDVRLKPANHLRSERNGELFTLRQIDVQASTSPGHGVAQVIGEILLGDQVDVAGARLGKGGMLALYARVHPHDRLEFEPSYTVSWIDGITGVEQGRRLYTEYALQLNGIYHFGAADTLRMILQKTNTRRDPALYSFPVAARISGDTASFVYNHTVSFGSALYVGLTLQNGDSPGFSPRRRQNELFMKLSWEL